MIKFANLNAALFVVTFCAVFFGQITYQSGVRISMPFRYIEVGILSFMIIVTLTRPMSSINIGNKNILFYFILFLLTAQSWVVGYELYFHNTPYIVFSIYVMLHSVAIYYLASEYYHSSTIMIQKWLMRLLLFHVFVSLSLYFLHIVGLNSVRLGINYHSINIPRLMGFVAEPSHYSVIAWITAYWSYYYFGVRSTVTIASFLAFIFSFSTTGIIFALLTVIFYAFMNVNLRSYVIVALLVAVTVILIPEQYHNRYMVRVEDELSLLYALIIHFDISAVETIQSNSRAINLFYQLSYLSNSFPMFLFGYGAGGQTLLIGSLGNIFDGMLYVLFEFGALGFIIVTTLLIRLYKITSSEYKPLFIAYFVISFFNSPGGNFGVDFIFVLLVIFLLSNIENHKHGSGKLCRKLKYNKNQLLHSSL